VPSENESCIILMHLKLDILSGLKARDSAVQSHDSTVSVPVCDGITAPFDTTRPAGQCPALVSTFFAAFSSAFAV
jgi:hypothetical protein